MQRTLRRRSHRNAVKIRKRMNTLLCSLDYDFARFTMETFKEWMERQRGRPITCVPWPMPLTQYGAWVTSDTAEYIFYDAECPPIHQVHIQLHEMAHMLCGHPTIDIQSQQASDLLQQLVGDPAGGSQLLLRSVHSDEAELEAEILASLIQERVLRSAGIETLSTGIAPDGDFVTQINHYFDTLRRYR
jgi:hypothetical protein